jgi:Uma2 family endonuclease
VRFTVSDILEMVERGILPEDGRIELLDGSLVYRDRFDLRGDQIEEGPKHTYVIAAIAQLSPRIDNQRRHLRTQSTLICSETHAPVPDGVILRGVLSDYRDRLPTAADAFCVIEVADSSYERDTGEKLTGYAKAGVGQYVVINLRARIAEVFVDPDTAKGIYPPARIVAENESLSLRVAGEELFTLALAELMP